MGLGKSLVILSAIAGSLNRAAAFSSRAKPRHRRSDELSDEQQDRSPTGATLIVVPSSLLIDNWIEEIRKHIYPGNIAFYKHHGNKRKDYAEDLFKANIVFTTYATIAAEASRNIDVVEGIHWFRIVLDEAHDIRNRHTKQFNALHRLTAEHRWCLTGTPIQNSLDDLGSLVTFLRVPVLESASTFRRYISTKCDPMTAQAFGPLRQLLTSICLRRTREYINLPDPVYDIRMIEFTDFEKARYKTIIEESSKLIQMAVSKRGTRKLHTTVLQSLLRLRLFCNNGNAVFKSALDADKLPTDPDEILTYLQQRNEAICAYCSGNIYTINDSQNADGGF
ncbi:DNA repair protein rad5 [Colletotrichum camelliae]|nr:DNA repair protein rad5 [Colletotrichum camelliae]